MVAVRWDSLRATQMDFQNKQLLLSDILDDVHFVIALGSNTIEKRSQHVRFLQLAMNYDGR